MDQEELKQRTKTFSIRVIRLVSALPKDRVGDVLGRQLLKSGTSIGANYREALRASSRRHFVTTLEIAQREAEETLYWPELIAESQVLAAKRLVDLQRECNELIAILTQTIRTTKKTS